MTPEQMALMLTIVDHSEDDVPRLVYADWLEENGESEHAAFIRLQVTKYRTSPRDPKFARLLQQEMDFAFREERRLRDRLPVFPGLIWGAFDRGFVDRLTIRGLEGVQSFSQHALKLVGETPWSELQIEQLREGYDLTPWLDLEPIPNLRQVTIGTGWGHWALGPLLHSPIMSTVRRLVIKDVWIDDATQLALHDSKQLKNLEELRLSRTGFQHVRLRRFSPARLPNLKRLIFRENKLTDEGLHELIRSGILDSLEVLDLTDNTIGSDGMDSLTEVQFMELHTLRLSQNQITDFGFHKFCFKTIPTLRSLELRACNRLTENNLVQLSQAVWLPQLTHLDLSGQESDGIMQPIIESSRLKNLRSLSLRNVPLKAESIRKLAESPHFENLTNLDLGTTELDDDALEPLLKMNLKSLFVHGSKITKGMLRRIRETFDRE